MTQYPPQPTGQPWGPSPAGEQPSGQPEVRAARPWYKKKRFIIPAGVVALFIAIGIMTGGGEDDPVASKSRETSEVVETTSAADASASAAEAEASAAAAEAEASAAAAEAEASAAAAEAEASAAAVEEAARVEAERVAAEQAAAEKAAADAAAAAAAGTVSQQNAVKKAESYLDISAFSRSGLIGQLEFEGFSTEDATWAVDKVAPDWNEQAALKAKSYLELSGFSRSGLIDQLVFEGFTAEQAEYGVSQVGL